MKCYGLDINAWDRGFLAKKCKKCKKNHILKPPTFTLIMLLSIQPVKIPEKITVFFFNNSCRKFNFSRGTGKNAKKWGFNPIKNIFTHQYFSVLSASLIKYDQ